MNGWMKPARMPGSPRRAIRAVAGGVLTVLLAGWSWCAVAAVFGSALPARQVVLPPRGDPGSQDQVTVDPHGHRFVLFSAREVTAPRVGGGRIRTMHYAVRLLDVRSGRVLKTVLLPLYDQPVVAAFDAPRGRVVVGVDRRPRVRPGIPDRSQAEVLRVDIRSGKVSAPTVLTRPSAPGATDPLGIAVDSRAERATVVSANGFAYDLNLRIGAVMAWTFVTSNPGPVASIVADADTGRFFIAGDNEPGALCKAWFSPRGATVKMCERIGYRWRRCRGV